ncbi:ketopantoate reductase family protein [Sphingomonas sp.]|uniref:ketopantoate reductase family protein n=1 Tax=Sphingomonas sp. TaxID=28214 RepID=UPI003B0094AA
MSTLVAPLKLRVAVLGVGNIGSTFAFQLARAGGHDVTVIARSGSVRLEQLRRDGAIVDVNGERANVHVADELNEHVPFDLVIVTLLAHQVDSVLPMLQRSAARCIQFMFNTFDPERLREAVGPDRCAFGMNFVQATLDTAGRLKAAVGAGGQKTLMDQRRWADLFNAAKLPAAVEPDMTSWLRCHVPLCVAFESVAVAGVRRGGGASWREALTLARGVHAGFGLIRSLGRPIYPRSKRMIDRSPASVLAVVLWSMSRVRSFRELLATGKAECAALVDAMIAAAPPGDASVDTSAIAAMKPL